MAEKLLGAIAQGTYRSATAPVRGVKEALDPKIMQTMYKAGILGPVLRSITSSYSSKEEKSGVQSNAITANVSKNLQSMSFQLSAIADIMDDIRELTKNQLKTNKEGIKSNEKILKRNELKGFEEKLESKSPLSSLMQQGSQTQSGTSGTPLVGGLIGGVLGFVKDNPILTGVLGALIFSAWPELQEKFKEFIDKSGIDKDLKQLKDNIYGSVKNGIAIIANNILKQLGLPELFTQQREGNQPSGTSQPSPPGTGMISGDVVTGGLVGGVASKLLLGKTLPGVVGGSIYGALGDSEYAGEAAIAGAVGTLAGGAILKRRMEQAKLNKAVEKAMQARGIGPVAPPTTPTVPSPITPSTPTSSIIVEEGGRKGREALARDERKEIRDESKKSLKGLVNRINGISKKYGSNKIYIWLAKKIGMSLGASLIGGPLGLIIGILSLGFSILQIGQLLDDFEEGADASARADVSETSAGMGSTFDMETGGYASEQTIPPSQQPALGSPLSSLIPSQSVGDRGTSAPYSGGITWNQLSEEQKQALLKSQAESEGYGRPNTLPTDLNNPGALTYRPWMAEYGATQDMTRGTEENKGKFARFPTPEAGFAAQRELWNRFYGNTPIDQALRKWVAPTPGAREAQFENYLKKSFEAINVAQPTYSPLSQPKPFTAADAKPEKDPLEMISELSGLRSMIDLFKQIPPPIVNAPTTVNNNNTTKGGGMRPSAPTIPPHSTTKDQLRVLLNPGNRYPVGMM